MTCPKVAATLPRVEQWVVSLSSELKKNLDKLWSDVEGRIFLINLAGQLSCGAVEPTKIALFLRKAKRPGADFGSRKRALASDPSGSGIGAYSIEAVHFASSLSPIIDDNNLVFRVGPMSVILDNILPEGGGRTRVAHETAKRILKEMSAATLAPKEFEKKEKRLKATLDGLVERSKVLADWGLDESSFGIPLNVGRMQRGLGCRPVNDQPVFFTTFAKCVSAIQAHPKLVADILRDMLGLDQMYRFYGRERSLYGWYCFKYAQVPSGTAKRPTVFDNTSNARFKGTHGTYGKVTGTMGRTADLSKIGTALTLDSCVEIVARNQSLPDGNQLALFGYLGAIEAPRGDEYNDPAKGSYLDQSFIDACLGAWTKDDVIDTIVGYAR